MIIALTLAVQAPVPCGTLPPVFHTPIVCPIAATAKMPGSVPAEDPDSGCFAVAREPGAEGGLRIPPQIACPLFTPKNGDEE